MHAIHFCEGDSLTHQMPRETPKKVRKKNSLPQSGKGMRLSALNHAGVCRNLIPQIVEAVLNLIVGGAGAVIIYSD